MFENFKSFFDPAKAQAELEKTQPNLREAQSKKRISEANLAAEIKKSKGWNEETERAKIREEFDREKAEYEMYLDGLSPEELEEEVTRKERAMNEAAERAK